MRIQAKEKCVPNMVHTRANLPMERCKEKINFFGMTGKFIEEVFKEKKSMGMEP